MFVHCLLLPAPKHDGLLGVKIDYEKMLSLSHILFGVPYSPVHSCFGLTFSLKFLKKFQTLISNNFDMSLLSFG